MAPCFIFLAAKVEEMPRKLEHVLKASHKCLRKEDPQLDVKSDVSLVLLTGLTQSLIKTFQFKDFAVQHNKSFALLRR